MPSLPSLLSFFKYWTFTALLVFTGASWTAEDTPETPKTVDEITLFGLSLVDLKAKDIRKHLRQLGGFHEARATYAQRNIDKFFPWSRMKDSYYVEFRYDGTGRLTSVYRLYRPESIAFENRLSRITTREVAQTIVSQIGQPTQVVRKGWGGSPDYTAYIWKSDQMTVEVDRQGSELYGNVFVRYTVNRDPYLVAEK
ncbi:MAG: hypothetical protein ACP5D0_00340 [Hydrogenovibrio sp.]